MADRELGPSTELLDLLLEGIFAKRISATEVVHLLDDDPYLADASAALDVYLRLGGSQVDLDYFKGRVRAYTPPDGAQVEREAPHENVDKNLPKAPEPGKRRISLEKLRSA